MIVAFVVDVHESMGEVYAAPPRSQQPGSAAMPHHPPQRGAGVAPIEWAKTAIESIIKDRRDRRRMNDQYLLLSTEDGPQCVKSSWGDPRPRFEEQLRLLAPVKSKPTSLSHGMSTALALMNQYRLPRNVDNYGQGRLPWFLELGALFVLTDGESCGVTGQDGKAGGGGVKKLQMTCSPQPGADLTKEPYRWDQRIFIMMMQRSNTPGPPLGNLGNVSLLRNLAEMTGGSFSACGSLTKLLESTSHACKKLATVGGVVGLAPCDDTPSNQFGGGNSLLPPGSGASHLLPTRGLISLGHELTSTTSTWPIPEAFWMDKGHVEIPRRDAHPVLLYRRLPDGSDDPAVTAAQELIRVGLVPDRYVVELWGAGLKMHPQQKWPVYIADSSRAKGRGEPFGYLEPLPQSTTGQVYLVLLPYNYPQLASLLQEAHNVGNLSEVSQKWRPDFNKYLASAPPYYYGPLRRAFKKLGAVLASQVPESKGGGLSSGALKRLQWCKEQVKEENDRLDKARSEHPNRGGGGVRAMVPLDVSHALAQQPQQNDASLLLSCIIPPSADLLPTWEHMRQDLFGPRGLTVAGLYAKGVKGARSICPMQQPQVREWTLLSEVGAALVPQNPIVEMGLFTEELRKKELLRDPSNIVPPEEETQEALMQKYLEVNFGNPFAGGMNGGPNGRKRTRPAGAEDEVQNEAALLGPVDYVVNGGLADGDGLIPREGDFSGIQDDNSPEADGRPARKRARLSELPPLPINKKLALRRQQSHRSLVSLISEQPPPHHAVGASTPMHMPPPADGSLGAGLDGEA